MIKHIKIRKTITVFGIVIYKKYRIRYKEEGFSYPVFADVVTEILGVKISATRLYYQ